ncbi:MAG: hypothetical protein RL701_610 [Pseudomonadota bacterium]|jgi:hypothetical protein
MPCDTIRQAWLSALAAREQPDAAVEQHFASCENCREFVVTQRKLSELWRKMSAIEPSLGFDTRFFARLETERREAATPRHRRWWLWLGGPTLALATTALVAVLVLRNTRRNEQPLMAADDVALMRDLDLAQELPVVERLDEIEAYEALAKLEPAELDKLLNTEVEP